jgi:hypothetical protein
MLFRRIFMVDRVLQIELKLHQKYTILIHHLRLLKVSLMRYILIIYMVWKSNIQYGNVKTETAPTLIKGLL